MISSELYDSKPDGFGGVTLTLRRPIQTRDARTIGPSMPLMRDGQAVRLPTSRQRGHTRDDVLTGPEPVTRISLGKVWVGDDGDPLVALANYATQALAEGCFAPDQVLHAETLENVISLGRTWTAQLEAIKSKLETADAMARAGGAKDDACDIPPHEKTKDATPPRSGLFSKGLSPAQYTEALKAGRKVQDASPPAVGARITTKDFAQLRAGKGAAKAKGHE